MYLLILRKRLILLIIGFYWWTLAHYGITGNILQWIQNYLGNRQQRVKLKGTTSALSNITCGVPQGSILRPLLFLIYINDLTTLSDKMFTIMIADDTSIFIQSNNIYYMEITKNWDKNDSPKSINFL